MNFNHVIQTSLFALGFVLSLAGNAQADEPGNRIFKNTDKAPPKVGAYLTYHSAKSMEDLGFTAARLEASVKENPKYKAELARLARVPIDSGNFYEKVAPYLNNIFFEAGPKEILGSAPIVLHREVVVQNRNPKSVAPKKAGAVAQPKIATTTSQGQ